MERDIHIYSEHLVPADDHQDPSTLLVGLVPYIPSTYLCTANKNGYQRYMPEQAM